MRRSYLLLTLVAGATAGDVVQSRKSIGRDVIVNSRDAAEISHPVEARTIPAIIELSQAPARKRDSPDPSDGAFDATRKHLQELEEQAQQLQQQQQRQQQQQQKQDDDDDDDDDDDKNKHSPTSTGPPGPPGGTIAGVVVGAIVAILIALALWYFLRLRPKRRQARARAAAAKEAELEGGYAMTPASSFRSSPTTAADTHNNGDRSEQGVPPEHIRWAPTPYPERAPSIHTGSSMSGLALPTPALTYSPSVTTGSAASPPEPGHAQTYQLPYQQQQQQCLTGTNTGTGASVGMGAGMGLGLGMGMSDIPSEKPPSYDSLAALQSSEPQPEASAYQMGQVPVEPEEDAPMVHIPLSTYEYGGAAANSSGEHMPRY